MTAASLSIDLNAIVANWRALDALSSANVETAAVIKADAYGLGVPYVAHPLLKAGVKSFFVATAEEAIPLYAAIGKAATIYVFSGHMPYDSRLYYEYPTVVPMLNSLDQVRRHFGKDFANAPFGLQIDTGMNRLGLEADELEQALKIIDGRKPELVISHLACADTPDHPQNTAQLSEFHRLTDRRGWRRSLAATGGVLLGPDYHFDLTRPGVGLYGGAPFGDANPVVNLSIPVIQTRVVAVGESVGYGATWVAERPSIIATLAAGYADGLIRIMGSGNAQVWALDTPCPVVGRVSMDMLTVDVTDLAETPTHLNILNDHQTVDKLADMAGTIGYEILTNLGARYIRDYTGG